MNETKIRRLCPTSAGDGPGAAGDGLTSAGRRPVVLHTDPAVPDAGTGAVDGRSARWEVHREERRRALISAARKAVHRLGADASMEDIAAAAGTSKSVFYRYFSDKAGLQQAVAEVVIDRMQDKILQAAKTAATPRQGLLSMVSAYLEMAETSPAVYDFVTRSPGEMAGVHGAPPAHGALGHFFDEVIAMVARPMSVYLGGAGLTLLDYWPTAAVGLVRTAGERWLGTPDSPGKPDHLQMAGYITSWLLSGIDSDLSTGPAGTPAERGPAMQHPATTQS